MQKEESKRAAVNLTGRDTCVAPERRSWKQRTHWVWHSEGLG